MRSQIFALILVSFVSNSAMAVTDNVQCLAYSDVGYRVPAEDKFVAFETSIGLAQADVGEVVSQNFLDKDPTSKFKAGKNNDLRVYTRFNRGQMTLSVLRHGEIRCAYWIAR